MAKLSKENGGSAFPAKHRFNEDGFMLEGAQAGMTLRDYFAAKAMNGLLVGTINRDSTAKTAYWIADAMLDARKL